MTEATTPAAETADSYDDWKISQLREEAKASPPSCHVAGNFKTREGCIAILRARDCGPVVAEYPVATEAGVRAAASEMYWAMTLEGLQVEVALVPKGLLAAGDQSTKGGCVAILKERDRQSARVRGLTEEANTEGGRGDCTACAHAMVAGDTEPCFSCLRTGTGERDNWAKGAGDEAAGGERVAFVEPPAPAAGPEEQETEQAATCGTCMVFVPSAAHPEEQCCARHGLPALPEEGACEEHETAQPEADASSGEEKAEAGAEEADPAPSPTSSAALTRQEVEEIVATAKPDEVAEDTRVVKEPLSEADEAQLAREMAVLTSKIVELQEKKKKAAADMKVLIDGKQAKLYQLGEEVNAGRDVTVPVEVRRYWPNNLRVVVRVDGAEGEMILDHRALEGAERQALIPGTEAPGSEDDSDVRCGACDDIPADSVDADGGPLCLSCAADMRAQQGEGPAPVCGDCHWWDTMACEGAGACSKAGPTGAPASEDNEAEACEGFALGASLSCKECRRRDDAAFHFESQTPAGEGPCLSYEPEEQAETPGPTAAPPLTCGTCDHRDADGICVNDADHDEVDAGDEACADHAPARDRCHDCHFWASNACAYNMSEDPEALSCTKFKEQERRGAALAIAGSLPPAPGSPADAPRPPAAPQRPEAA